MRQTGLILACVAGAAVSAGADVLTLPPSHATVAGDASLNSLIRESPRVYQAVVAASELTAVPRGSEITALTWRIRANGTATWPEADAHWNRYMIELSTSRNPPGSLSTVFDANRGDDAVVVRDGPLTIPALTFPGGAMGPTPNDFGFDIRFDRPFVYEGGDLLMTIRHDGHSLSTTRFLDSISQNSTQLGYGTRFQNIRADGDFHAATGFQTNFTITRITYGEGVSPCYPDCNGDEMLTLDDFLCFMDEFAAAHQLSPQQQIASYANCTGATAPPILGIDDFLCFMDEFAAGCP